MPETPIYTSQSIFDKVATHLFTQGVQSKSPTNRKCLYRGPNNTSCAVGCLIPDELYEPEMDADYGANAIEAVLDVYPELEFLRQFRSLLSQLQGVHDRIASWSSTASMRRTLKEVAWLHNVDCSILQTLSFKDR